MKQFFILIAAVAVLSIQASAQRPASPSSPVRARSWLLGGQLSFESRSGDLYKDSDGDAVTALALSPEAQYFIIDYFAIGAVMQFNTVSSDIETSNLLFGPKVSYYFRTSNRYFYPFVSIGALIGSYSYEYTIPGYSSEIPTTVKYSDTETRFIFSGGVLFMINQHVGIATVLSYQLVNQNLDNDHLYINEENQTASTSRSGNVFGISVGVNAFIP